MQLLATGYEGYFVWRVTDIPNPFNRTYYSWIGLSTSFVQPNTSYPPIGMIQNVAAVDGYPYNYTPQYQLSVAPGYYSLYAFVADTQGRCTPVNTSPVTIFVSYTPKYSVTLSCGEGVSSFLVNINNSTYTITGYTTIQNVIADTYTIYSVTPQDDYITPYIMYYNIASEPENQYAGSKEFNSTDTFSVSNYNRLIQIAATPDIHYYYKCVVYLDDVEWYESNTVRTTDDIVYIDDIIDSYSGGYNVDRITGNGYTITGTYYYLTPSKNDPSMPVVFRLYCNRGLVTPDIEYVSATATTITVSWKKNGGTVGSWYILYDTVGTDWNTSTKIRVTTPGNYTITNLDYKKGYFISCVNSSGLAYKQSEDIYVERGGGGGGGGGGRTIQPFAWTLNDDQYIKAGQPITNMKASAWNNLIAKINELLSVYGMSSSGLSQVGAGDPVTKSRFNALRTQLARVPGVGAVVPEIGAGYQTIKATYFANDLKYYEDLKSAVNRAVSSANT